MNDSDRPSTGGPSDPSQRAKGAQPSVLQMLEARAQSKLGVELDSREADVPSDVANALRDPAGRYQMLGEIGRGGMGVVYRGRDQDLGREVAMKVLHDEYAARPDVLARFVEEAQIGGQLQHPGIVPVYELGLQAGERPYFAMKLVKGETLAAQLAKRADTTHERRRFLGVFEQVCQTIAYAHARRVVHRDLKPANVMIGAFGEVQVVDWGFAKVLLAGEREVESASAPRSVIETVRSRGDSGSRSVMGSMFGTPAYMPPEQALGDVARVDERSDVFALGAILCEILTGEPPYDGEAVQIVRRAAKADVGDAHERLKKCGADDALIALAIECLSPAQAARPASAAEVATRVSGYLTSVEERAREAQVRAAEARVKHRATLVSAAAGLLVLALGAGVWIWLQNAAQSRRSAASQRVATAMSAASGARGQAQTGGFDAALWSAAVASAEQLVSQARSDDVDAATRADAEALLAAVTGEANAARAEADRRARDQTMLAELELARIPADEDLRVDTTKDLRRLDAAYGAAFAKYLGAPLFEQASDDALASMRRGDIEIELAASLDHWGLTRDALKLERDPPDAAGTARMRELAMQLDAGDAWRVQLRALLPNAARERSRLVELAKHADFPALTPVGTRVLGQALWSAGEKEWTVAVLRRGQELHPRDFDLSFQLGLALELLDQPRRLEAIDAYRIAHAIRPEQNEVVHRQVLAMKELGRYADEERLARILSARNPSNAHWLNHVGMALSNQRRHAEALECFHASLALDPSNAMVHGDAGTALQLLGRLDEALESYERAIELDPRYTLGHVNLGDTLALLGRHEEAFASHRRALEIEPDSVAAHLAIGNAFLQQGELDRALEHMRRAVELDPGHARAQVNLGAVLARQRKFDGAAACMRRAIELDPGDAAAHSQLAWVLTMQGKHDEAIACYRRLLELQPESAPTHFNLGITLQEKGDRDAAIASFRRAASIWAAQNDAFSTEWRARAEKRIAQLESAAGENREGETPEKDD